MGEKVRKASKAQELINAAAVATSMLADRRQKAEIASLKSTNEALIKEIESCREALAISQIIGAAKPPKPVKRRERASGVREATAVLLCSDWHVEEKVCPLKVEGRNEYNPTIARTRAHKLAEALAWLVTHQRNGFAIRDIVIWLGGDLITGYIHEELMESNFMSPTEAVLFAQELIEHLINAALAIDGIERVIVPTSHGNHGRTTYKTRVSTGAANSFEWLMYMSLKRRYANDKRVEFHVADGEHNYLKIYDWDVRFTHGDAVRYAGGVGGITIPLNKAIAKWQTFKPAHLTCFGHYHQYLDTPSFVGNGSLIGYSEYALRVAAAFEAPAQAFFLMDSKRGKCQSTAAWVS